MPLKSIEKSLRNIYPTVFNFLSDTTANQLLKNLDDDFNWDDLSMLLESLTAELNLDDFIAQLAQAEAAIFEAGNEQVQPHANGNDPVLNPSVEIIQTDWQLEEIIGEHAHAKPLRQKGYLIIWKKPETGIVKFKKADKEELLCVKMIVEELSAEEVAKIGEINPMGVKQALKRCCSKGILLGPESKLKRLPQDLPPQSCDCFDVTTTTFTLQWHITHTCDLSCKHCYDRTKLDATTIPQAQKVINDMWDFCQDRNVGGHICFSGGNPFLHPEFFTIYKMAADQGFSTSVLGNPVSEEMLKKLMQIQPPSYYQVSLEGLEEHNNLIRGKNHFNRTLDFLELLENMEISSAVMLTLTKDNMGQIIELADFLKDKAEYFTFNRLSPVGQGAQLQLPDKEDFYQFIKQYVTESEKNPIMGYKDNLINIELSRRGWQLFDGCTGFGCGAAFNFFAILPNGEAHACRKFPSFIGNVYTDTIATVYDSNLAQKYRAGSAACVKCRFKPVCGGCMASVNGHDLDVFNDKDPFCFKEKLDSE